MDVDKGEIHGESSLQSLNSATRVFSIQEVFDGIMGLSDRTTCARCIRVCQACKDVAKDHTWRSMESLTPLLQVLAPLQEDAFARKKTLIFSRMITPGDWKKYAYYANSVNSLTLTPRGVDRMLDDCVLVQILAWRPANTPLLPNLTSLDVEYIGIPRAFMSFVSSLFHEKLEQFTVRRFPPISPPEATEMISLLQAASSFAPNIKSFEIRTQNGQDSLPYPFQGPLRDVISTWKLQTFTTSYQLFSSSMLDTLSHHEGLAELYLLRNQEKEVYDKMNYLVDVPVVPVPPSAFQNLAIIDLHLGSKSVRFFFCSNSTYPSLKNVALEIIVDVDDEDDTLVECITYVCASCPMLESFALRYYGDEMSALIGGESETVPAEDLVDLDFLLPLSQLKQLKHLSLDHRWQLPLNNEKLLDFALKFPRLRTLHLNPEPESHVVEPPDLSLDVLADLAPVMPCLQTLRLLVNTSPGKTNATPLVKRRFESLQTLSFGSSALEVGSKKDALVFLGQVVPNGCTLCSDRLIPSFREDNLSKSRRKEWKVVGEMSQNILRVRELTETANRKRRLSA